MHFPACWGLRALTGKDSNQKTTQSLAMKESGKMDFVLKKHKTNSSGQNHWGLLIMGNDGRRGEREPKFLAVINFSTPPWNDFGKSEKTVWRASQKRFLSCQGAQY
jgi:hypothetical protein